MIEASARGSYGAIATALRPFVRRRVASDADADDVLQDVLLRIERSSETLEDPSRFGAWVHRVARHAVIDHRRRATRARARERAADVLGAAPEDREETMRQVLAAYVASRVDDLPSPYREAVALVDVQGVPSIEAAARLGLSPSGMKSRVQRGRAKLRALLDASCTIDVDARGRPIDCAPRVRPTRGPCSCDPYGVRR